MRDADEALRRFAQVLAGRPVHWWWPASWPAGDEPARRESDQARDQAGEGAATSLPVPWPRHGPYRSHSASRRWHRLRMIALGRHRDPWASALTHGPFRAHGPGGGPGAVGCAANDDKSRGPIVRSSPWSGALQRHAPADPGIGQTAIAMILVRTMAAIDLDAHVATAFPGAIADLDRWRRLQRRLAMRHDGAGPAGRDGACAYRHIFGLADRWLAGSRAPRRSSHTTPPDAGTDDPLRVRLDRVAAWLVHTARREPLAFGHLQARAHGRAVQSPLLRATRIAWRLLAHHGLVAPEWPFGPTLAIDDILAGSAGSPSAGLPPGPSRASGTGRTRDAGAGRSAADADAGGPGQGADAAAGTAQAARPGRGEGKGAGLRATGTAEPGVSRYPVDEWSYLEGRRLPAHCLLHERRLVGTDLHTLARLRARRPGLLAAVRRAFLQAPSFGRSVGLPEADGDWLDIDAAREAVIAARLGRPGDNRVYRRRVPGRRDLAIALLLDMSASTDCPVPGASTQVRPAATPAADEDDFPLAWGGLHAEIAARPTPRRVIDVAKDALVLCGAALAELGDPFAIYGFSGSGRMRVDFYVAKPFGARADARHWAAIDAMQPRQYTRMGAAIRHACWRLRREPAARRALLIVSDGYPQDSDYGPDRRDERYGLEDTAHALAEAASQGVRAVCLTVDPAGHDYLSRMLPAHAYRIIADVEDLPLALAQASAMLRGIR
ncbi:MAG: hypothetical protein R3E83_01240 [Burkholderiaceae bacterium]